MVEYPGWTSWDSLLQRQPEEGAQSQCCTRKLWVQVSGQAAGGGSSQMSLGWASWRAWDSTNLRESGKSSLWWHSCFYLHPQKGTYSGQDRVVQAHWQSVAISAQWPRDALCIDTKVHAYTKVKTQPTKNRRVFYGRCSEQFTTQESKISRPCVAHRVQENEYGHLFPNSLDL